MAHSGGSVSTFKWLALRHSADEMAAVLFVDRETVLLWDRTKPELSSDQIEALDAWARHVEALERKRIAVYRRSHKRGSQS